MYSSILGPFSRNARFIGSGAASPTVRERYSHTLSNVSGWPAWADLEFKGSQTAPPETAVDPPARFVFSTRRTSNPSRLAVTAADIPPAPLPRTTPSTVLPH